MKPTRICTFTECEKSAVRRGMCDLHYRRWMRAASAEDRKRPTNDELFWAKVNKTATCWIWTGGLSDTGYGGAWDGNKVRGAHRMSWEAHRGPIPDGMHLDHKCHNRACVNPEHLRIATPKQNLENHQGPTIASTTGARGVYLDKRSGRFATQVTHHRERYSAGGFATIEEASAAVTELRNRLFTRNDRDRIAA